MWALSRNTVSRFSLLLSDRSSDKIYDCGLPSIPVTLCSLLIPSLSAGSQDISFYPLPRDFLDLNPLFHHLPRVENPPAQSAELEEFFGSSQHMSTTMHSDLKFVSSQFGMLYALSRTPWLWYHPLYNSG